MKPSAHKLLHSFLLFLLGAGLLALSWHKWADIVVDTGRELYIPWRIAQGQVLYKDIAFLFGPLSPCLNALLFKLFGSGMMTLVFFNILLIAGMTFLIYRITGILSNPSAAFMAGAVFLVLFAFGSYAPPWVFNYVCPYSYSVTYALFLSLWAVYLFVLPDGGTPQLCRMFWTGFLLGTCALSRLEIFLSSAAALLCGWVIKGVMERRQAGQASKRSLALAAGWCIPPAAAILYFSTQMPFNAKLLQQVFGYNPHWPAVSSIYMYKSMSGLLTAQMNLKFLIFAAGFYIWTVEALAFLCQGPNGITGMRKGRGWVLLCLGMGMFGTVIWLICSNLHMDVFRGLPLLLIFMAGNSGARLARSRPDPDTRLLPLLVMAVWGLLMSLKIIFAVKVAGYGFVYAVPAVLMFIVFFMDWVPDMIGRMHGRGRLAGGLSLVLLSCLLGVYLINTIHFYLSRKVCVAVGPQVMCLGAADVPKGTAAAAFLEDVDRIMGKNETFVAFPEGTMLNFLSRRANPLPYVTFLPAMLTTYGEGTVLRSFIDRRPDYVVFVDRPLSAYGLAAPGRDYAKAIVSWIKDNYDPVWKTGREPFTNQGFGITVLKSRVAKS